MTKRVLDVGNCGIDHAPIARMLRSSFGAEVLQVENLDQARAQLADGDFHLVLVNRKLDIDYSDGMEVIRALKADAQYASIPMMLVSNYPEAQAEAVAAGALEGFGKLELNSPATLDRLRPVLG